MADSKGKEVSLTENIFMATLAFTFELALIYFVTTFLIFCGLYATVWSIQGVGLLAIFHLVAIPIAYFGVRDDNRTLVLLSLLLCCVWFILIIVFVVVFSIHDFKGNDFTIRPLHHIVLAFYATLDGVVVVLLSIDIINEKSRISLRKSLTQSPPTEPAQPAPTGDKSKKN